MTTVNKMKKKRKKTAPKRTQHEDKLIAYHEAGHAVMALHKGSKYIEVDIDLPDFISDKTGVAAVCLVWQSKKETRKNKGLVLLAGFASECIMLNDVPHARISDTSQNDYSEFSKLWKTKEAREKNRDKLLIESVKFLKKPKIWRQVEIIADALLNVRQLNYRQLKSLIMLERFNSFFADNGRNDDKS